MAHGDWIPRRELEFVEFAEKWKTALSDSVKQGAFGWATADCTAVTDKITAFLSARSTYETDDSTRNRLAKDEAKEEAVDAMRDFANTSVRFNKKMKDEDKLELGIRPADTTPTTHEAPTSQPETDVLGSINNFEHKVRALNRVTGDTSKPADAYGVRYSWQVGGEKPLDGAKLTETEFSRRTTLTVAYTEADKAKTAYYATCYENAKGKRGTWSPIVEAVIA